MAKPQLNTRVDDELKQQIEEYAERRGINQAQATRSVLRRGINSTPLWVDVVVNVISMLMVFAIAVAVVGGVGLVAVAPAVLAAAVLVLVGVVLLGALYLMPPRGFST